MTYINLYNIYNSINHKNLLFKVEIDGLKYTNINILVIQNKLLNI